MEILWLKIYFKNAKTFLVAVLYRSPNSFNHLHKNFTDILSEVPKNVSMENKEITILGDINCDFLKRDDH